MLNCMQKARFVPAYHTDQWSEELPTELPPATWPVADHIFNVLIKPLSSCSIKRGTKDYVQNGWVGLIHSGYE